MTKRRQFLGMVLFLAGSIRGLVLLMTPSRLPTKVLPP